MSADIFHRQPDTRRKIFRESNRIRVLWARSPMAVGMAIAGKMDGRAYRVFTLMGDGELAEVPTGKPPWRRLTINWII